MIKASINNLIGIEVDENYPWMNTLFINSGVATFNDEDFIKCKANITVIKCKTIDNKDCRDIGDGIYIGTNVLVDTKYGVRLERNKPNHIILKVNQECNEWLIISVQLLLLEIDCTLIHAAALEKEGEVVLLPSWGGVGKTATVVRMIRENGWRLLGDDLVILKDNMILPFLKPFVIYPYHRTLFPEVFAEKRGRVITNLKLSKILSRLIPFVKRTLRFFPGLLAFARKHNPQSIRVSPNNLFNREQLSKGGNLSKIVWLERVVNSKVEFYEMSSESIASKTASVSMMELFADRIINIFALCGAGIFDYQKIYIKMYDLIVNAYKENENHIFELDIPTSVPIEKVGKIVYENITSDE